MFVTNILSSHYRGSFTQALLDSFVEGLETAGHSCESIDLYELGYNPVMAGEDFNQFFGKPLPGETEYHHDLLRRSDVVTFFYPVWWNDMPAIMKGWVDRVFARGFAYEVTPEGVVGCLPFKKAILICTLGNKAEDMHPALEEAMRHKERYGVFGYGGVMEVEHHFLYEVGNKELCTKYLADAREMGLNLRVN